MSATQTVTETTTVTRKRKKKEKPTVVKATKTNKSVGATVSRAKSPKKRRCPTCGKPL